MSGPPLAAPLTGGAAGLVVDGRIDASGAQRLELVRLLRRASRIGLHVALLTDGADARLDRALVLAPRGPGRLWLVGADGYGAADVVEVTRSGSRRRPRPEAASPRETAAALLAHEGATGELALAITADQLPSTLAALLRRARGHRVPGVDRDPGWTLVEDGEDPDRHRVTESLFTLCSGGVGLRGAVEERGGAGRHLLIAAGVYAGVGPATHLLAGPDPLDLVLDPPVVADTRVLDLRTGVLLREERGSGEVLRSARFASVVQPGAFAIRVEAARDRLRRPRATTDDAVWRQETGGGGGIGIAVHDHWSRDADIEVLERVVQVDACDSAPANRRRATAALDRLRRQGFDRMLAAQRSAWAGRWRRVDVRIPADPSTELALRFALFQLWSLADTGRRELAVGARGLTGTGYGGHVFWDADVFVLPALATVSPEAADLVLAYRLRRLGAARERARADGRKGARFAWESAGSGEDVTPRVGYVGGERIPIATGQREEHITADVAWSVVHQATWRARAGRLTRAEESLVAETARYWSSRIQRSPDGTAHLEQVIGPDEYHERVDDNAYTNVMARWNLREAARRGLGSEDERRHWLRLADALVDGYDPGRGVHEQFRGYFALEPLVVRDLATPPVAADVLAGRERIAGSQIAKQADVLMLHHLVPDDLPPGSLSADYDFYAPRIAHGSSLSPGVTASVAARAHRAEEALELLRLSLRIDLEDLGGTTGAGVHLGACGGAWQAVINGFLGVRVVDGVLEIDPVLPESWPSLEVRFRCLGRDVHVHVAREVTVAASAPLLVRVTGRPAIAGRHVRLARLRRKDP